MCFVCACGLFECVFFFTEVVYLQHRLVATWLVPRTQYRTYVASNKNNDVVSRCMVVWCTQNVRQDSSSFTRHSVYLSLRKKYDFDVPFTLQVQANLFSILMKGSKDLQSTTADRRQTRR